MELHNRQDEVLRVLKVLEPRLRGIRTVAVADGPLLHGDIGIDRLVALPLMGEGIVRLVNLALNISNTPDGVGLVDEIENGLHHSVLLDIWRALADAARLFDTQVFATTHSFDCVVAAHEAFSSDEGDDFRLLRLDRINGDIRAASYDRDALEAAIQAGLEVR